MRIEIPTMSEVNLKPIFELRRDPVKLPRAFPKLSVELNIPEHMLLTFSWVVRWYFEWAYSVISGKRGIIKKG